MTRENTHKDISKYVDASLQHYAELASEVSALKRELALLRAQEERYRLLANSSSDWIYWLAPGGRFVFISSACERITGYPPQRFYDDPSFVWSIVHPEDAEMLMHHTKCREDVEHAALYFRILHADGRIRWISHTCSPIIDDAGTYQGRRGSNRDVTERVDAELARSHSDARYKAMFEGIDSSVAVYQVIGDGAAFIFTEFNRAAEMSSGMRREDVLGRRVEDVFPGVFDLGLYALFERVYITGIPERLPVHHYEDNRVTLWVENYVYKLSSGEIVAVYSDKTAEKNFEQDLRISQRRFEEAVEATSDGIWDWHIPSGRTYFSPRYFTMLGYEPDEFPHSLDTFSLLVHPDDLDGVLSAARQHFTNEGFYCPEFRMRSKSGEWRWILARGQVVERDADWQPVRMVGTHIDIHERRQMHLRLTESLSELEALNTLGQNVGVSISLEEVVRAAMEWIVRVLHPNLVALYQVSQKKLVLMDYRTEGITFDVTQAWCVGRGECLCGLSAQQVDVVYAEDVEVDGRCSREMCCQSRSHFLRSMAALISSAIANAMLHQRALSHADDLEETVAARTVDLQKFYNAVEHSPVSIVITDTEGRIEYVNPFFCEVTGYSLEEAVGQNPRVLKSGLHDDALYTQLWTTISQGKTWRGEMCNRKKNGKIFWELMAIAPVRERNGNIGHYVAIKEDISDKKDLERLKEDVDRIMRHDLKTPLNAIIGLPQVLAMDDNLTPAQHEILHALEDSGRKMLHMIDRSLDIFKMEVGTYEYRPKPVDAVLAVMRLLHQNTSKLSAKKLSWRVSINGKTVSEGAPFVLESEEGLLYSLLSNIIINAIEASPLGGEVGVEFEDLSDDAREHVSRGRSAPLAYLRVRNAGVVPEQIHEHFFEKYKTFGKKRGTGLGTYSAKLLAKTMGYGISMHTSDADNETVVSILAPRVQSRQ